MDQIQKVTEIAAINEGVELEPGDCVLVFSEDEKDRIEEALASMSTEEETLSESSGNDACFEVTRREFGLPAEATRVAIVGQKHNYPIGVLSYNGVFYAADPNGESLHQVWESESLDDLLDMLKDDVYGSNMDVVHESLSESVQQGGYYKLDMSVVKSKYGTIPATMKLIRKMVKSGGGQVYVVDVKGSDAMIAGSPMDAMLGTARVPVSALR